MKTRLGIFLLGNRCLSRPSSRKGPISAGDYGSHPAFTPNGRTLCFVKSTPTFSFCTVALLSVGDKCTEALKLTNSLGWLENYPHCNFASLPLAAALPMARLRSYASASCGNGAVGAPRRDTSCGCRHV